MSAKTTTMTAHPSRAWRRRAHDSAVAWLLRWRWEPDAAVHTMSPEQLRGVMQRAYLAGYEAGRLDGRPRQGEA